MARSRPYNRQVTFHLNPMGIRQLEQQFERGLVACGEAVADSARANIRPYRFTGAIEDSIHVNENHVNEWPRAAVFVATASGDGYYVEMGTRHSPARLFLSQALDSNVGQFGRIMQGVR